MKIEGFIYSKPTRCIKCSLVNEMTHPANTDPKTGGWTCSKCGHLYLFAHWKIKKAGRDTAKVSTLPDDPLDLRAAG